MSLISSLMPAIGHPMNLEEILAELAEALELERELGVRAVEIDRSLLVAGAPARPEPARPTREDVRRETSDVSGDVRRETPVASGVARRETSGASGVARRETPAKSELPLLFLHDRALSQGGVEMMAKIVTAMHQTPETAPVLFTGKRPSARVTVVLGLRALRHWFPGAAGSPGQWISPDGLSNVLVTYSPEYILRFGTSSSAVKKLKMEMWTSLKAALQRMS